MNTVWTALGWLLGAVVFTLWALILWGGLFFLPRRRRR